MPKLKVEIVVPNEATDKVVDMIVKAAGTGPVERAKFWSRMFGLGGVGSTSRPPHVARRASCQKKPLASKGCKKSASVSACAG